MIQRLIQTSLISTTIGVVAVIGVMSVIGACQTAPEPEADILIRGARILDGSGEAGYEGDLAVTSGRITAIGPSLEISAKQIVEAEGRVVAPGFIDMMGATSIPLLLDPVSAESKLRQGITTMLAGEGGSVAPQNELTLPEPMVAVDGAQYSWTSFDEYLSLLAERGIALNVVHNVGAAQVRRVVLGDEDIDPSPEQLTKMKEYVEQAMEAGAIGLSTALIYPPGTYAETEEIVALAEVAAAHDGVYFSHMRNESYAVLEAIEEVLEIGKQAKIPVHIFHLKAAGEENWPLMEKSLALIESARDEGDERIDVTADVYPYIRNGIGLGSFLHPRHYATGTRPFLETLSDAEVRAALREEVETTSDWENWYRHVGKNWDNVLVRRVESDAGNELAGKSVQEIALERGDDVWETFFDLVQLGGVSVNPKSMNEAQKHLAMRASFMCFDNDAAPTNPASAEGAHPRAFGAFPRILSKYVREESVISLSEAIHKLSALPASILRLKDRGSLAPGMVADLVLFDPDTVRDRATFSDPLQYSEGMDYVMVAGEWVIEGGASTGALAGEVIRHGR